MKDPQQQTQQTQSEHQRQYCRDAGYSNDPWQAVPEVFGKATMIVDINKRIIASVLGPHECANRTRSEQKANADLMAAAPDMLLACKYAMSALTNGDAMPEWAIDKLRAAIAKATGAEVAK